MHTLVAYVLWLPGLFGICGLHRFYLGRPISGILWLVTFGLLGLGQLIDLLLIPSMAEDAFGGRHYRNNQNTNTNVVHVNVINRVSGRRQDDDYDDEEDDRPRRRTRRSDRNDFDFS